MSENVSEITINKIASGSLMVFPATRRTQFPYQSRLISEESISRFFKVYGDKESFVIQTPTKDGGKISCEFVVCGHYFSLIDADYDENMPYVCVEFVGPDTVELNIGDEVDKDTGKSFVTGVYFSPKAVNGYSNDIRTKSISLGKNDINYTRYSAEFIDLFKKDISGNYLIDKPLHIDGGYIK